ncbi:MAG: amidohydrolase [Clostridia bacterium]|nr:amidohydrolase [Clostridia bacterium]
MTKEEVKRKFLSEVDSLREDIFRFAEDILENPELGFKEKKTADKMAGAFRELGLRTKEGIALTGVVGRASGRSEGGRVALIGELDAVISPEHPFADPKTGAAHSCGHYIQLAGVYGVAKAFCRAGIMEHLDGEAVFLCAPAEEFVELEYRAGLREEGKISCLSGKQEMIRLGVFDGIDAALMVHSQANRPKRAFFVGGGALGFMAKLVTFRGKAAHACTPEEGVNALNAAMAAMMCIHAMRETFRPEDRIKVHPIITRGGDLVNIVPSDVRMEMYVRGATPAAVRDACEKVDRAIRGAAYAIGCEVEIRDLGGYAPLRQDRILSEVFASNASYVDPSAPVVTGQDMVGSTDMGDLSCVIPAIQPTIGGFEGSAHSREFRSVDDDFTILGTVKTMGLTAIDLLWDGAAKLKEIKQAFQPVERS